MQATWRTVQTASGTDLDLMSAARGVVRGAEAVAARVAIALGTRRGDWPGDLLAGPDDDLIRGRLAYLGEAEREFQREAQAQTGVVSASVQRTAYNAATRVGTYSCEVSVDADNGGTGFDLTL